MKLISCHDGKLHVLASGSPPAAGAARARSFATGLPVLDALSPGGSFARGALHELLFEPGVTRPMLPAAVLARCAGDFGQTDVHGAIIWSDPAHELYPPALAALGIPLQQLFLLRPSSEADQVWAVTECLRCRGVAAVVATLPGRTAQTGGLSRVQARRLRLAAERGGGVGLLIRPAGTASAEHAAVTRWLVQPASGEQNVQRWRIQLLFGHGGRVGESVILEHHRETNRMCASAELAHREMEKTAGATRKRASA